METKEISWLVGAGVASDIRGGKSPKTSPDSGSMEAALVSLGFSRHEYWSGLQFPSPKKDKAEINEKRK